MTSPSNLSHGTGWFLISWFQNSGHWYRLTQKLSSICPPSLTFIFVLLLDFCYSLRGDTPFHSRPSNRIKVHSTEHQSTENSPFLVQSTENFVKVVFSTQNQFWLWYLEVARSSMYLLPYYLSYETVALCPMYGKPWVNVFIHS